MIELALFTETNLKFELELGLFTDELSPVRLLNVKRVQINDFGLYKRAEPRLESSKTNKEKI